MNISIYLLLVLSLASAKLAVYNPTSLRNKIDKNTGIIKSSLANFGYFPYGHSIIGKVWYDVKSEDGEDNTDGCRRFEEDFITGEGDPDTSPSPIVLVERGNCSFVRKVRNVERGGGSLAIIIDNKPGERADHVVMVDDGSGHGVNIPSMLISKSDGAKISKLRFLIYVEKQLKECKEDEIRSCVQLIASFDLPHPDNRVEYDFWYTSSDEQAQEFLTEWESYHNKFKKDVYFTPRLFTMECES